MKSLIGMFAFFLGGAVFLTWITDGTGSTNWLPRFVTYGMVVLAAFTLLLIILDGLKHRRKKKAEARPKHDSDPQGDWRANP